MGVDGGGGGRGGEGGNGERGGRREGVDCGEVRSRGGEGREKGGWIGERG